MDFKKTKRHLPHFEDPGRIYFITFSSKNRELLSEKAKEIVYKSLLFHNNKKYELHAFIIMNEHVHLILQPLLKVKEYYSLSEIMHSIKSYSANEINKVRQASLPVSGLPDENKKKQIVWQDESFDRIIRDEKEYQEKIQYIINNSIEEPENKKYLYLLYTNKEIGRDACPPLLVEKNMIKPVGQASSPDKLELIGDKR